MAEFGPSITEVQRIVGDHFAPAQGGRFASSRVADVLAARVALHVGELLITGGEFDPQIVVVAGVGAEPVEKLHGSIEEQPP